MHGMVLPIIIAVTVTAGAFGITQIIASVTDGEKRKLKQRLLGTNEASKRLSDVQRTLKLQAYADNFR